LMDEECNSYCCGNSNVCSFDCYSEV